MRFRALPIGLAIIIITALACRENVLGGAGCITATSPQDPILCPQEAAPLKDTVLDAVALDTSVIGFPPLGYESTLILATRGDTLDSRIVARYDSTPLTYKFGTIDSVINRVDSVYIKAPIVGQDSLTAFGGPATVQVYDVTDAVNDTASASLVAQFTAGNLIGSKVYAAGDSPDTLIVLLDTARVRSRIINSRGIRIGLRMVTTGSEQMRISSQNAGGGILLSVHFTRDVTIPPLVLAVRSATPANATFLQSPLGDFAFFAGGRPYPGPTVLRVGGFPARRVLLRFNIPSRIVDSSVVIRATLFLTQRPLTSAAQAGDSIRIHAVPIIGSTQITDVRTLLEFAGSPAAYPLDSLSVIPADSAKRQIELVNVIRAWRGQDTVRTPRAVALMTLSEGLRPGAVDFFSIEAPLGVRPQLRITYITKVNTGLP